MSYRKNKIIVFTMIISIIITLTACQKNAPNESTTIESTTLTQAQTTNPITTTTTTVPKESNTTIVKTETTTQKHNNNQHSQSKETSPSTTVSKDQTTPALTEEEEFIVRAIKATLNDLYVPSSFAVYNIVSYDYTFEQGVTCSVVDYNGNRLPKGTHTIKIYAMEYEAQNKMGALLRSNVAIYRDYHDEGANYNPPYDLFLYYDEPNSRYMFKGLVSDRISNIKYFDVEKLLNYV